MIFHANVGLASPKRQRLGHRKCLHCLQQFHINLFHWHQAEEESFPYGKGLPVGRFFEKLHSLDRQPRNSSFHRRDLRTSNA
jgi:hypothetical protein